MAKGPPAKGRPLNIGWSQIRFAVKHFPCLHLTITIVFAFCYSYKYSGTVKHKKFLVRAVCASPHLIAYHVDFDARQRYANLVQFAIACNCLDRLVAVCFVQFTSLLDRISATAPQVAKG